MDKLSPRKKLKIHTYIILMTVIATITGFITFSYYSLNILQKHKSRDTIAILYYDFSHEAILLTKKFYRLSIIASDKTINLSPDEQKDYISLTFARDHKNLLVEKGLGRKTIPIREIGLGKASLKDKYNFLSISGRNYVARAIAPTSGSKEGEIRMWPVDLRPALQHRYKNSTNTKVYLLTTEGKLMYSNSPLVTPANFENRELVRSFINSQLREGQMEVNEAGEGTLYGFFTPIPLTNLILFAESSENMIIDQVLGVVKNLIYAGLLILLAIIIITNFGLGSIRNILSELAGFVEKFSNGLFHVVPQAKSFGELQILRDSFVDLGAALIARDSKIIGLIEKEKEKIALEKELDIAQRIQENFLPHKLLNIHANLDISAIYQPAGYVAGDWFTYFYHEKQKKFMMAIADVSGHGSGSALFTSMLASIFSIESQNTLENPREIFDKINSVIQKFGKNAWHVSVQIGILDLEVENLTLYNAGHLPPILLLKRDSTYAPKAVSLPSTPLGLAEEVTIASKTFDVKGGGFFCFHTDGLNEQRNFRNELLGNKRLRQICLRSASQSSNYATAEIMKTLKLFMQEEKQVDDICVLAIKYK